LRTVLKVVVPKATADGERGEGLAICGHVIGFRFYGNLPHTVGFCVLLLAIGTALAFSADVIGSASRNPAAAMQWLLLPQMILGLLSVGVQPAELFPTMDNRSSGTSPLLNGFYALRALAGDLTSPLAKK
jgi:ABC-2 type transport system permease protein